jgi:uncharacterized repeat protein (TIGR04138 family)
MNTANFDETLDLIVQKDPRYHREAYLFVREALDHTQKMVNKGSKTESRQAAATGDIAEGKVRHVTGQELLAGIRDYALNEYGPMTLTVLNEWGVQRCEDFGELVFIMVENHLLAKTKKDTRDDFKGGYDFAEAFRKPFLPAAKTSAPAAEPKSTNV